MSVVYRRQDIPSHSAAVVVHVRAPIALLDGDANGAGRLADEALAGSREPSHADRDDAGGRALPRQLQQTRGSEPDDDEEGRRGAPDSGNVFCLRSGARTDRVYVPTSEREPRDLSRDL